MVRSSDRGRTEAAGDDRPADVAPDPARPSDAVCSAGWTTRSVGRTWVATNVGSSIEQATIRHLRQRDHVHPSGRRGSPPDPTGRRRSSSTWTTRPMRCVATDPTWFNRTHEPNRTRRSPVRSDPCGPGAASRARARSRSRAGVGDCGSTPRRTTTLPTWSIEWARAREARYVCAANVHMAMEANDDPAFQAVVNECRPGHVRRHAARLGAATVGGSRSARPRLRSDPDAPRLRAGRPGRGADRLPWRPPRGRRRARRASDRALPGPEGGVRGGARPSGHRSPADEAAAVAAIAASGARILFVGLGCPKQERWMAAHRAALPLVQLGVGAAFDFHAGAVRQAPKWLQDIGHGMGVPPRDGAATPGRPLPEAQPPLRRAVRARSWLRRSVRRPRA